MAVKKHVPVKPRHPVGDGATNLGARLANKRKAETQLAPRSPHQAKIKNYAAARFAQRMLPFLLRLLMTGSKIFMLMFCKRPAIFTGRPLCKAVWDAVIKAIGFIPAVSANRLKGCC